MDDNEDDYDGPPGSARVLVWLGACTSTFRVLFPSERTAAKREFWILCDSDALVDGGWAAQVSSAMDDCQENSIAMLALVSCECCYSEFDILTPLQKDQYYYWMLRAAQKPGWYTGLKYYRVHHSVKLSSLVTIPSLTLRERQWVCQLPSWILDELDSRLPGTPRWFRKARDRLPQDVMVDTLVIMPPAMMQTLHLGGNSFSLWGASGSSSRNGWSYGSAISYHDPIFRSLTNPVRLCGWQATLAETNLPPANRPNFTFHNWNMDGLKHFKHFLDGFKSLFQKWLEMHRFDREGDVPLVERITLRSEVVEIQKLLGGAESFIDNTVVSLKSSETKSKSFDTPTLLAAFLLGMNLRQMKTSQLMVALKMGLKLASPKCDETVAMERVQQLFAKKMLPSKSTLNRTRERADIAEMIRWQRLWEKLLEQRVTVWPGWDSSPHRHRHLEVIACKYATRNELLNIHVCLMILDNLCLAHLILHCYS